MKKTEVKEVPIQLTVRNVEMAIYGLKIWRQVVMAEMFAEFRDAQKSIPYEEAMGDIDETLEKLERAKEKF
jgi:hypothetical protein